MKKTIENGQIVLRYLNCTVRYDLALVRKQIEKHEKELETWREYVRLLTMPAPDAVDFARLLGFVSADNLSTSKSES